MLPDNPAGFLRRFPPFDRLTDDQVNDAIRGLSPVRYQSGETVLERWERPANLYLLNQGVIEEQDGQGAVGRYWPGDAFDFKALIDGRSENRFLARDEVLCYLLPAPVFASLSRQNRAFRDFCQDQVARKLDALIHVQQQREAASFLLTRIGDVMLHPPLFIDAGSTIGDATRTMAANQSSFVLVRADGRVAIFTRRDVRERVDLQGMADSAALLPLASQDLITLERDDFLFNGLVVMTKNEIRHVVVTHGGEIEGVLEQADLLSHLDNSSHVITVRAERASSLDELAEAGRSVPRLIESMNARGVRPRYIARLVTDLNRKVFRGVYEQILPPDVQRDGCLIVMGSEGRGEQLFRTDQDNAIVFRNEPDRDLIQPALDRFTQSVIELGYPPCPGGVMVSNPKWAKSLKAFRADINRWIRQPTGEGLLDMAIFCDGVAVAGDLALLTELKQYMFELLRQVEMPVGYFAKAVLAFDTPLGLFDRFVTERSGPHAGHLDLKRGGIFPIVHGVRSLALEARVIETNTIGRIQALTGRGALDEAFTADLIEAFDFMSMLRLSAHIDKAKRQVAADNYIDPNKLNKLERGLLRNSLKVVKEFKLNLSHHFRLDYVS
jgi:CBS domain-containing protein